MRALIALLLFLPLLGLAQSETPRPSHMDAAPNAGGHLSNKTTALWDVKFNYDLTSTCGVGNAGVVWTGSEFWVSRWGSDTLFRLNSSGASLGYFTIPGVSGVRGMTYHRQDGHVYVGNNTTTINKINTTTRTSVGTITAPQTVRWITYDSTAASGAGGFWIGNFGSNINQIGMTGTTLATIASATHGLTGMYGGAIDHWSTGGPYLWVFDQTGGGVLHQLDLPTGVPTGVTHDVATDAGSGVSGILAGGLYICKNGFGSTPTMMGVCQGTPNRLFGYELVDPANMDLENTSLSIPGYVAIGATSVTGMVSNIGLTTVTSFDLSYSINGGAAVTTTISSVSISTGGTYNYTHPTAMNFASAGSNNVKVWISNVNGGSLDANKTNDTLETTVVVLTSVPTKYVILEDHTGAWCQYCPDGTVVLEQVLTANPNVIGVAVHNSDMMDSASTQWSGYRLQSTYISGFPGGMIDHFKFADETAVEVNRGTWATHISERLAMPSPASVNISSASYNSTTRTISATVDATFYGDMSGNFRINLFVTADSLIGSGTGWNQVNYYNTVSGHPSLALATLSLDLSTITFC